MITNFLKKKYWKNMYIYPFFPKKFKIASYIYIYIYINYIYTYVVFEILSRIMNLLK